MHSTARFLPPAVLTAAAFLASCSAAPENTDLFPTRTPGSTAAAFPAFAALVREISGGVDPRDPYAGVGKAAAATAPEATAATPALEPAPFEVALGSCAAIVAETSWEMNWSGLVDKRFLGMSTAPGAFKLDTDNEPGFRDQTGRTTLSATTTIVVQARAPVSFTVGSNGVYELTLLQGENAETLLSERPESYQEHAATVKLTPGIYTLVLQYFDRDGAVRLSFATSPKALHWTRITECGGSVTAPPSMPYFVYASSMESMADVARRFGADEQEMAVINRHGESGVYLVPGGRR